jgi:hypothetical protein
MPLGAKHRYALQRLASQPEGSMRAFDFASLLDHSVDTGQELFRSGLISLTDSAVMITDLGREVLGYEQG